MFCLCIGDHLCACSGNPLQGSGHFGNNHVAGLGVTTLEYDLPWPLDELKNILRAAHMCVGTMMRGGRQLSLDDWFVAVSSGNHFTK